MSRLRHIIPEQYIGSKTGARARVTCASEPAAMNLFRIAARRLLDVNRWGHISGDRDDAFVLYDAAGNIIRRSYPDIGNLIRIRLPAPGNRTGGGYDWVRIEQIDNAQDGATHTESIALRVRPVAAPVKAADTDTAHFYTREATSTFCVLRKGKHVWAMEFGRNEVANTKVPLLTAVRNLAIAIVAWLGLARVRWTGLMRGLLGIG